MVEASRRRVRDPEATRADILEAALVLLSQDGPEALSLSAVAVKAGVNRGTAYQHFETREKLIHETLQEVSNRMFFAVFGDPEAVGERDVEKVDMVETTSRLANFAMENPNLCRIWFLQVLALPDPSADPFWREYVGSIGRFAGTPAAKEGIDVEVMSLIFLAGNFLWPVWAQSHSQDDEERTALADRFTREMLRLSLYGSVNPDQVPDVVEALSSEKLLNRSPSNKPVQ